MLTPSLVAVLSPQAGVVSRRQIHQAGLSPHDLQRLIRRRDLTRVHPGVYVDHTGPLLWLQRAWAAVLLPEPSALYGASALRAWDGPGRTGVDDDPIHVAVDRHRHLRAPAGISLHRVSGLGERVHPVAEPPRVRVEHAVLCVAAATSSDGAVIATLADAVQSRRTTAERLSATAASIPRLRHRALIESVLADVADGSCSALEVGYARVVERAHGLPRPRRQARGSSRGTVLRDVLYEPYSLVVELDGRLFHDSARSRHRDLTRDLDAAVEGLRTVRIGWGQVFAEPCRTAERIGHLLRQGGWDGRPTPCAICR